MKKTLSIILALAMVLALLPTVVLADYYDDTDGHWAEDAINEWTDVHVVNGEGDGGFHPDAELTRAEGAQIFVNLLQLSDLYDLSGYTDVPVDEWYYPTMSKIVASGIMGGMSYTTLEPDTSMTREMLFVMIARALGIKPAETTDKAGLFEDFDEISDWAQGLTYALMNMDILGGVDLTHLAPGVNIDRASTITVVDRLIGTYANVDGTYKIADGNKITLVVAKNVTLTGTYDRQPIVLYGTNGTVNVSNVRGTATYNVMVPGVKVYGAAAGTVFNLGPRATGLVVNGVLIPAGTTTYTVPSGTWNPTEPQPTESQPTEPPTTEPVPTEHTVTYHSNYPAGSGKEDTTKTQPTDSTTTEPKSFTVEACTFANPTTHHLFAGWADILGNTYEVGTEYSIDTDLALYAQWVDTNDNIGMAVMEAMEQFNLSFKTLENVGHEDAYSMKLNPLGYNSKVTGTGEAMARQQFVNASASVTTDLANDMVAYACTAAINILGGESIKNAAPQEVKDLINEVIDAIEATALGNIFHKGDEGNLNALKNRIFNAVRAVGGDLFGKTFKRSDGSYVVSKITVTVGGTSAALNVSANGISVEGNRNTAVKNLAVAIAKDLYNSLTSYREYSSKVQLTSTLNIEFKRADGVDTTHEHPVKYPTTISLELDSDGLAMVKFDADKDNGKGGKGAVVVKVNGGTIADTYEGEIAKVIDELLEGDAVQQQIQEAVDSVGEGEGVLSKIQAAFESFGLSNVEAKAKVDDALTKWVEKNKELLIKGTVSQNYANEDIEQIVIDLAEAAAKKVNEELDAKIAEAEGQDGGALVKRVINEIIRASAEPEGENSLGGLLESQSGLIGDAIDLKSIEELKKAELDTYVYAVICDAMRKAVNKPEEAVFTAKYVATMKAAVENHVSEEIGNTLKNDPELKNVLDVLSKLETLDTAKDISLDELEKLVDNSLVSTMLEDMSVAEKVPTLKKYLDRLPANASVTVETKDGKTYTLTTSELKGLKDGLRQGIKDLVNDGNKDLTAGEFDIDGGLKVTVQYNSRTFTFWLWIDFDGVAPTV